MIRLLKFCMVITLMCFLKGCYQNPYFDSNKPHHTPEGFQNVPPTHKKSYKNMVEWRRQRKKMGIKTPVFDHEPLPKIKTDLEAAIHSPQPTVTWVGHATLLLQINGKVILTDPQFSDRASPVNFAGPKRYMSVPFTIHDLPQLDYVLISHDHYDHLDDGTVRQIAIKFPNAIFFSPLGYKHWLSKRGVKNIFEMDWWDEREIESFKFICSPVQHWTKRTLWDNDRKLWSGWSVLAPNFKFFFAGDTGYADHFKKIGEKYGPFDLAAIPIGAYEPRWFMKESHVNPEEAVKVHQDLRAKHSIGIHWGTFILTDEPYDQPPKDLASAMKAANLKPETFWVFTHGETKVLK